MNHTAFSKLIEQALLIRLALEALLPVIAVLCCLTLAAFVVYLIGVFHLCRAEARPGQDDRFLPMDSSMGRRFYLWSEARRGKVPLGQAYPRTHKVR